MFELLKNFLDPQFTVTILVAVAAFATVVTIAMPALQGDRLENRMKVMAKERAAIRARERAKLFEEKSAGSLRSNPKGYMKTVVDRLQLAKAFDATAATQRLRMAGYRGQAPVVAFMFFRLVMPIVVFLAVLFYLFVINDFGHTAMIRFAMAIGGAYLGFYLPNLYVTNVIQKRQQKMMRSWPDALDLLLICVEAGMSIEAAFKKVAAEIGSQCIELAEELTLTTAELSYLQDRRKAYENLGTRTGLDGVKAATTSLIQAEKYGTPLGQAIRTLSQDSRDERMTAAEKKAAALPPKLTVPMILFFLPVLFIVILGPAAIRVMALD
jgi:tight adherence protein C